MLKGTVPTRFVVFSENTSRRFPLEVRTDYLLFLDRRKNHVPWSVQMGWRGNSGPLAHKPHTVARVRTLLRAQQRPPACTIATICRTQADGRPAGEATPAAEAPGRSGP